MREVEFVRNELIADESGALRARPTGEHETIPAGLVMRAIGYRGMPLPDVPFDERRHVSPTTKGRVLDGRRSPLRRVRGRLDQARTVRRDRHEQEGCAGDGRRAARGSRGAERPPRAGRRPTRRRSSALLRERQPDLVTYAGWDQIDRHERALGEPHGRPRVKLTRIEEMLEIAARQHPDAGEPQVNGDQPEADADGDPERRRAQDGRAAAPMAD